MADRTGHVGPAKLVKALVADYVALRALPNRAWPPSFGHSVVKFCRQPWQGQNSVTSCDIMNITNSIKI